MPVLLVLLHCNSLVALVMLSGLVVLGAAAHLALTCAPLHPLVESHVQYVRVYVEAVGVVSRNG